MHLKLLKEIDFSSEFWLSSETTEICVENKKSTNWVILYLKAYKENIKQTINNRIIEILYLKLIIKFKTKTL